GIVLDRHIPVPLWASLLAALLGLAVWGINRGRNTSLLDLVWLWFSVGALGAAYHQWRREVVAGDDIRHFATEEPRVAHLRGELASEPIFVRGQPSGDLRAFPSPDSRRAVLLVTQLEVDGSWHVVSGYAQLTTPALNADLSIGSRIEATGQLSLPPGAANP